MNNKFIFWAVDCQKDFMDHNGKLYVEGAEDIKNYILDTDRLANDYMQQMPNNFSKIFTKDWHSNHSKEFSDNPDFVNTFPAHCIKDSKGAELIDGLDEGTGFIIKKDEFDTFADTELTNKYIENLKKSDNKLIHIVYGVTTDVCVNFVVNGLMDRNEDIILVTDAIKELPNADMDSLLNSWVRSEKGSITFSVINFPKNYDLSDNKIAKWIKQHGYLWGIQDLKYLIHTLKN